MSDLLDRKEAVDAVKNEMLSWLKGDSHDYRDVVDAIMDLPTVDISHYALYFGECKGCKYRRVKVDICQHCARNCDDEYEEEERKEE